MINATNEASGPTLAEFYTNLGLDAEHIESGDFTVSIYDPEHVVVHYPAMVMVTTEQFAEALASIKSKATPGPAQVVRPEGIASTSAVMTGDES